MRTRLDTDVESIQREAQLRRIGRDLNDQATSISSDTVDAVAAVVAKLAAATDYGELVDGGFDRAMKVEAGGAAYSAGVAVGDVNAVTDEPVKQ